jgi:thymidylate synthase (FAD)
MQKVDLLTIPDNILKTIYTACRTCYSSEYPIDIFEAETDDYEMQKLVKKVIESGHTSTTEHVYFTFSISGVSRACTHQLVRHRHASFSQKSQRYVTEDEPLDFEFVTPESVKNARGICTPTYNDFMLNACILYHLLIKDGIPPEDARMVLPNAAASSMVVTMNLRSLIQFCSLRMCSNAQSEIRQVSNKMAELVTEKEPWLADYLAPKCKGLGYCDEIRPCGSMKTKAEVLG